MLTIDFETEGIEGNPIYNPPKPVGVSIKWDGNKSDYLAWGHPSENNISREDGHARLREAIDKADGEFLAHNAPFECAVLREHHDYVPPDPLKVHDTQYLLFLTDPYAWSFSLKPSAERVLGLPPDEQTELKEWIIRNVTGAKESNFGAFISKAPGGLVGRYAEGDTDRTFLLYERLMPDVHAAGMALSYQREQSLMPILSESSQRGMRVDTERLSNDIELYSTAKERAEEYIRKSLGDFNIDSDRELAEALDRAGMVTEWVLTPTGKRSTARKNLVGRVRDPDLLAYLGYRGVLATCLGTFAEPWLAQATAEGGRLHPQWNQVRGDRGSDGDVTGTRTGRMSCKAPNLQNVPNDFETLVIPDAIKALFEGTERPPVIYMRRYLLPEEGHIWLKRDFSAQEMRILAHFAEGKLYEAYKANPNVDPHKMVQEELKKLLGIDLPRKLLKIIAFGIMYGRGVKNLALALGVTDEEAKRFRDAYYTLLPEVRELSFETRNRGKRNSGIRTWGGRVYYREPNPDRDLSYKLLNYLIQGSAADQTKQAMIDWNAARGRNDILLAAVHDEINISAPEHEARDAMRRLEAAMDAPRFDVPFRSEGFWGPNWSDIEEFA